MTYINSQTRTFTFINAGQELQDRVPKDVFTASVLKLQIQVQNKWISLQPILPLLEPK